MAYFPSEWCLQLFQNFGAFLNLIINHFMILWQVYALHKTIQGLGYFFLPPEPFEVLPWLGRWRLFGL